MSNESSNPIELPTKSIYALCRYGNVSSMIFRRQAMLFPVENVMAHGQAVMDIGHTSKEQRELSQNRR